MTVCHQSHTAVVARAVRLGRGDHGFVERSSIVKATDRGPAGTGAGLVRPRWPLVAEGSVARRERPGHDWRERKSSEPRHVGMPLTAVEIVLVHGVA